MALPATDVFTGTNGTALQTYSASWSINSGSFNIQSNAVVCASGAESGARWNADTFNNDQYSQAIITVAADYAGVACRLDTGGAATYYGMYFQNSPTGQFFRMVAGVWTQMGSDVPVASGSLVKIEAIGQQITVYDDGVSINSVNNSAIASGSAGLTGFGTGTVSLMDTWEGGNTSGGAVAPVLQDLAHRPFHQMMMAR